MEWFIFESLFFFELCTDWSVFFGGSESVCLLEESCDDVDDSESLVVEESEPLDDELELLDPDDDPVVDSDEQTS